jgi:hypothetical protein
LFKIATSNEWSISGIRDWPRTENWNGRALNIECCSIWINEVEPTVVILAVGFVFCIGVSFSICVFDWLNVSTLNSFCNSNLMEYDNLLDDILVDHSIADINLFWVMVFEEVSPDQRVAVDVHTKLFKDIVDVGVAFRFTAFS